MNIRNFLRQPTTVAGLATLAGTAQSLLLGHLSASTALALAVGALVAIVLPDNTAAQADAASLVAAAEALRSAVATPLSSNSEKKQ